MLFTDNKGDYAGWTIQLKNWQSPLYVQAELPARHIAWTADLKRALGFKKKREAVEFLERLGENVDGCLLRFHPWRRSQRRGE